MFVHGWTMTSSWTEIVYDELSETVPDHVVCALADTSEMPPCSSKDSCGMRFARVVEKIINRTNPIAIVVDLWGFCIPLA